MQNILSYSFPEISKRLISAFCKFLIIYTGPITDISLNNLTLITLSKALSLFISITFPIRIPSGKIADLPPVSIVSPISTGAYLGISINCTVL